MRLVRSSPPLCERARAWVSLRLDGELSQLEGAMLNAHLARCAACSSYAADVAEITSALRAAALASLTAPVAVPHRRRLPLRLANVSAAAALLAVAAGIGVVMNGSHGRVPARSVAPVGAAGLASETRQLQDLRRAQLRVEAAMLQTTNSRPVFGHAT